MGLCGVNVWRPWAAFALALTCLGAMAQPVSHVHVTLERADFDNRVSAARDGYLAPQNSPDALNLRIWARSGNTSWSIGTASSLSSAAADFTSPNPMAPSVAGGLFAVGPGTSSRSANAWLWGVHRQLGGGTRVSLEQAWWRAGADAVSGAALPARSDVRVGFEFKPTNALTRYGVSRESLLRFQLSGSWSVSMRPRSGGLALALRASL